MNVGALIGIDIGTTATKIIAIDTHGRILAEVSRPATLHSPQANFAEADPAEWWDNLGSGIPACLKRARLKPGDISAVGVCGMVPTTILVGIDGVPLRRSIQQNDARSHKEISDFLSRVDHEDVFRRTGSAITQQSIGPKLLWLAKHEPENLAKTSFVMGSYDYINYCLTGMPVLERNWALESGLFGIYTEDWDEELMALAQVKPTQLPRVLRPSDLAGRITPEAARHTGLRTGTPVVAGSADHVASAFSVGIKDNGDLLVKLGGAGDILYSLDHLEIDRRLFIDYHVIPGLYLINGCMASSGSIIKWFRDNFAPALEYTDLDAEAALIPTGSDGLLLLPYFIGEKTPIFDPLARGLFFGLTLLHTRAHLYRAILEGISFGFYHHLQVLAERGFGIQRVRVANGGARSRLWRQVTADVIGLELEEVAHHPGSSLGAAFIAGMGVGAFSEWSQIERYISLETTTRPDMKNHAHYIKMYELFRQLYESNRQNFDHLARLEALPAEASKTGGAL
jgi:xylulokinase